ncbi:hypothetical protein BDW66DRAFT_152547 [Aspergillus desertorum]
MTRISNIFLNGHRVQSDNLITLYSVRLMLRPANPFQGQPGSAYVYLTEEKPELQETGPLLPIGSAVLSNAQRHNSLTAFSKAQFADLSIVEEHVLNLFGRTPQDVETVDLQRLFFTFTFTVDSATHSPLSSSSHKYPVCDAIYLLPAWRDVDGGQPVIVVKEMTVHDPPWMIHRSTSSTGTSRGEFLLGQQKALTDAAYVVVQMVQIFCNVEARDEWPWREHMGLILSSYYEVSVRMMARNRQHRDGQRHGYDSGWDEMGRTGGILRAVGLRFSGAQHRSTGLIA